MRWQTALTTLEKYFETGTEWSSASLILKDPSGSIEIKQWGPPLLDSNQSRELIDTIKRLEDALQETPDHKLFAEEGEEHIPGLVVDEIEANTMQQFDQDDEEAARVLDMIKQDGGRDIQDYGPYIAAAGDLTASVSLSPVNYADITTPIKTRHTSVPRKVMNIPNIRLPQTPAFHSLYTKINEITVEMAEQDADSDTESDLEADEFGPRLPALMLLGPTHAGTNASADLWLKDETDAVDSPVQHRHSTQPHHMRSPATPPQRDQTPKPYSIQSSPESSPISLTNQSSILSPDDGILAVNSDILVTTEVLEAHGLLYNRACHLMICRPCGTGLPLRSVIRHLKRPTMTRMEWIDSRKEWASSRTELAHNPTDHMVTGSYLKKVIASLLEYGFIDEEADILDSGIPEEWQAFTETMIGNSTEPVLGLRVYHNCYQCPMKGCAGRVITPSDGTYQNHMSKFHPVVKPKTRPPPKMITAQTLTDYNGRFLRYFPIIQVEDDINVATVTPHSVPTPQTAEERLKTKMSRVLGPLDMGQTEDLRTVLPVYYKQGVHGFLINYNRQTIRQPFEVDKNSLILKNLRYIVVKSFQMDVVRLPNLHESIRARMTNCTDGVPFHFKKRTFEAPSQNTSRAAYASEEVRMMWAILQGYLLSKQSVPNNPFNFNLNQAAVLKKLYKELAREPFNVDDATMALYNAFDEIYFPEKCPQNSFLHPVVVFLVLECLSSSGEYTDIHLYPPIIAKIQFSMRLRASHNFYEWTKPKASASSPDSDLGSKMFDRCIRFSEDHLQDYNLSPFSTVRCFMHHFSVVAKAHPRATLVWWKDNTVTVGDTVVDFTRYRLFLKQRLEDTEKHILEKVLFGLFSMDQVENDLGFSKLRNLSKKEDSIYGKGLLLDASVIYFHNDDFYAMFAKMVENQCLGVHENAQGNLSFNKQQSLKWLAAVDEAMETVMALCHVLQGPPGRLTEEAALPLTNTHDMKQALFWDEDEKTGGFRSGYHKGAYITGDHKTILRLLPRRVFALLYILVRLVRPLELTLLFDFVVSEDRQQSTSDAYKNNIFASQGRGWDAAYMGQVLARFFKNGLGIDMGARVFRHYAIAVQRRFTETNYNIYKTDDKEARLAKVADLMAGHTTRVAEMHYARESGPIIGVITHSDYVRICKDWHTLHNFDTGISN